MVDLAGQALDLGDGFTDHPITFAGLLIGHYRRFRGFLGVTCDLMHGGGHFVHGGGHLVGLDLLIVDPGAGLLGDRRQLFGGAGDLGDAVADAADQFAQAYGHALHAALQLAQLVTPIDLEVVAQVATGDPVGGVEGLAQGDDDLPGNGPGGQQAEQQGQHRGQGQHRLGVLRLVIAQGGEGGGQLLALFDQVLAQHNHLLRGLLGGALRVAELDHGAAVVAQGAGGLVEVAGVAGWQHFSQGLELRGGLVDGLQRGLLELGLAAVGVATHLETRLLQQFAGADHTVEQVQVAAAE
ncbi:hypothetical protein D3C81_1138570 [compost metagenome]